MADTYVGTSAAIAQKIWRKALIHQAERHWLTHLLISKDEDAAIHMQEETSRESGDTVQVRFSPTEDQPGFGENDDIEGNEAALTFSYDEYKIGYRAFAFSQRSPMSQQRVNINLKKSALHKHPILWKRYRERSILAQLGGAQYLNTAAGLAAIQAIDTEYVPLVTDDNNLTGMNAAAAIDSNHLFYAGGKTTAADVAGESTAIMSLSLIDNLEEAANSRKSMDYPIPRCHLGCYVLIISTEAKKQLRQSTAAGTWGDFQRARLEGGLPWMDSEFVKGALGYYNNTLVVVSDYLPRAWDSADTPLVNTRMNLFLGAKAGCIAYGQGYTGGDHLDWTEQVRNYKTWGSATDTIWGCKRTTFDNLSGTSETYGCLGLVTYVAN